VWLGSLHESALAILREMKWGISVLSISALLVGGCLHAVCDGAACGEGVGSSENELDSGLQVLPRSVPDGGTCIDTAQCETGLECDLACYFSNGWQATGVYAATGHCLPNRDHCSDAGSCDISEYCDFEQRCRHVLDSFRLGYEGECSTYCPAPCTWGPLCTCYCNACPLLYFSDAGF